MIKNIAFDIDGCMNHFQDSLRTILERDYYANTPSDEWNLLHYANINTHDEHMEFFKKYNPEFFELDKEENVTEVLLKLRSMGYKIKILTAREYNVAAMTEKWLKKNNIYYDTIYFNCGNKLEACKWLNIDIMVEDYDVNALLLAENGIKVLLYDRPYNKNVRHDNIIRCSNWYDVYKNIV